MRLIELREERNITQTTLATAIQTSRTNIGRWEKGLNEPTLSQIIKLADFFEVSTDYLLGREDDFGNISIQKEKPASLSEDELRLLKVYRALNTKNRIRITTYAEVRLEEQGDDAAFPFRK